MGMIFKTPEQKERDWALKQIRQLMNETYKERGAFATLFPFKDTFSVCVLESSDKSRQERFSYCTADYQRAIQFISNQFSQDKEVNAMEISA